ncbi:MAG: glycosyltransferase family 4 protein [Acidobacteriia bacterium]|nr:glycosyltransferase family 4 protein [Terriglobia bacterium]
MNRTLGYVTPVRAYCSAGGIYMQAASGKVADALAAQYDKVYMCTRVVEGPPDSPAELPLAAKNIELIPQPFWRTSAGSLPHFFGIARAYLRTCRRSDVLFVRGMCPYIGVLYLCALMFRRPICHWIVGDPVALLQTSTRKGRLRDTFAWLYALQDRAVSRVGRWMTGGAFICNGRELARAYASPRTIATVSSTVEESDFSPRFDTCQGPSVRILFVGYIRPEKGIEYLLDAVSQLRHDGPWELEIVGPDQFPDYRRKLDGIVTARKIQNRVRWIGYVPFGEPLFDRMRAADLFVLPTLSEGTPHVLVEARACGLPCISTTVGGVPTTVTHGIDALLVPPKDSRALARAMQRVIRDADLRRALIRNGLASARLQTLGYFTEIVLRELEIKLDRGKPEVAQEIGPRA